MSTRITEARVATLETAYLDAQKAVRRDRSTKNRTAYRKAKYAFQEARTSWRQQEVDAGRRPSGVTASSTKEA